MTGSKKEQGIVHRKADEVTAGQHADTLIPINEEYKEWLSSIGTRYRQTQIRAAVKVNETMLMFYFTLGADIFRMKQNFGYGDKFLETVSRDMKNVLPDVKSFSPRNLAYMVKFY